MRRNVLAKFRKAAGLSQTELAKRSGVSFKYITAIEQEDRVPGVDFAEKLAKAVGVPAERIFFRPSSAGVDRLTALEQLHPGVLGQLPFDDVARIERVLAAMTPDMAKSVLSPKRTWEQALGALVI